MLQDLDTLATFFALESAAPHSADLLRDEVKLSRLILSHLSFFLLEEDT